MRQGLLTLPLLLWVGCASYDMSNLESTGGVPVQSDDGPEDSSGTAPSADSGGSLIPSVAYYALNLGFELVGGTEDANGEWASNLLTVDLYSDGEELDVVCQHPVPIITVIEEAIPPIEPPLVAWWQLDLDDGDSGDDLCPEWPARTWWIGLGPYDQRLDPMMAERGSLGFDVYGLYLREALGDPVYIVGMAGTNDMISGEVGLTVGPDTPLPDGQYQAQSLLLMSLE